MKDLIIALSEEIGDPNFFMGRKAEMRFYLDWVEKTKRLHGKSKALLSRRKRGKTALVQRLFNILYSNNDPQIIPFFFRVPETKMHKGDFGLVFYRTFMGQFLGFLRREPRLINAPPTLGELKELVQDDPDLSRDVSAMEELKDNPLQAWLHAQSAPHRFAGQLNIRIIQIIDEFQYMNRFIFSDEALTMQENLCHSYMGLAESKYAPLLVTGSYIGWLTTILNYMTSRFQPAHLNALADEEALAAVYNYAGLVNRKVTEDTASYIAEVAYNDPFYISQIVQTDQIDPDLTTKEGVRAALQFETTFPGGYTAHVWMEYIAEGVKRVNDQNGKAIVLYLAKCGNEERSRKQIAEDLNLDLSDKQLEDRLYMLKQADLIAPGSSAYHFKGLGDPIFAAIFRKHYGAEIEQIEPAQVTADFEREMEKAKRQTARYKGLAGEYKVMYLLLSAVNQGLKPEDVLFNPVADFTLRGFETLEKRSIHWDQTNSAIVDIYGKSQCEGDADLIAEVKTWEKPVTSETVEAFIELKEKLTSKLEQKTAFLFYSENGFTPNGEQRLKENGVMYTTRQKLMGASGS